MLFNNFIFALLSTVGFAIIFHVPKRAILPASLVGALGWVTYMYAHSLGYSKIIAAFLAAFTVGILGYFCARFLHDALTVFVLPGILPLVPGAGMYYTMLAVVESDYALMLSKAGETMLLAGAIAVGLMLASTLTNLPAMISEKFKNAN